MGPEGVFHDPSAFLGLPRVDAHQRALHVWTRRAFQSPVSHTVYARPEGFLVRRVLLVHGGPDPEPQPWGADGHASASVVRPILDALEALTLAPFAPRSSWGLDGSSYGVEVGDLWRSARLSWWESQSGWEPLIAWHASASEALDVCLVAHRPPRRA